MSEAAGVSAAPSPDGAGPASAAGSASADGPPRPAPPTFEAARAELEEVVRRLETGGCTLEESLALWERGEELAGICQAFLDGARARLAARQADGPGPVAQQPR